MFENRDELCGHGRAEARETLCDIAAEAIRAVHPDETVPCHLSRDGATLRIDGGTYDLSTRDVHLLAVGKGSGAVAEAVAEALGDHLVGGIVVDKHEWTVRGDGLAHYTAGHPVPDEAGRAAATAVETWADDRNATDLVVVCITGGASALLPAPTGDIELTHLVDLTDAMLASGAPIEDINAVRKHLSTLKGGRLLERLAPASVATLVVVDEVAGDPWGPTMPDESTFADAVAALRRHGLWSDAPEPVRAHLLAGVEGTVSETPTRRELTEHDARTVVLADADDCCTAAATAAERRGYESLVLSTTIEGESREVATALSAIAREADDSGRPVEPPCVIVTGGETTVTLDGEAGEGGPNAEFALSAARTLAGRPVALLALGTDGTDGPTEHAGGLVDGGTAARAATQGVDVADALARHDSTAALRELGDAVRTGGTGTNVMDLRLFLVEE